MTKSKDIKPVVMQSLGFRLKERLPVRYSCGNDRMTKQAFKDECDINNIVSKFQQGVIPVTNNLEPQYGESPVMDLKEALDTVFGVRGEFAELSPEQRALFNHQEENYFDFLADPDGYYSEIRANFVSQSGAKVGSDSPSADPSETKNEATDSAG